MSNKEKAFLKPIRKIWDMDDTMMGVIDTWCKDILDDTKIKVKDEMVV